MNDSPTGQLVVLINLVKWLGWLILMLWMSYSVFPYITTWLKIIVGRPF